jgi:molybdate transport system substrate-binding protein
MKKFWSILLAVMLVAALGVAGCGTDNTSQPTPVDEVSFEGETLNLYVAAGMKKAMDQVIEIFEEKTKATVAVNYGSSGGLYAQIEQGQPCDIYFSADWLYIEKLLEADKVEESRKFLNDNLVLVVSESAKDKVTKMEDLCKEGVTLVIADPQAPVGVYSETALRNLGLWDNVSIKAMPSTVNQVAIMVKEDQLDAGLLYSSVAKANGFEPVEVIDDQYSGEIIFGLAVMKDGKKDMAKAFMQEAIDNVQIFEQYGWRAYE